MITRIWTCQRRELLIIFAGTLATFLLAVSYVKPLGAGAWAQNLSVPAVNYACTGHFFGKPSDLKQKKTTSPYSQFLLARRTEFSCGSFPKDIPEKSFFDGGIDYANVEVPIYLLSLLGVLWRLFGVSWAVVPYILGASAAATFLIMYLGARRFINGTFAALIMLFVLASPLFITNNISPRDTLKLPFVVAISVLLVGYATAQRRPLRFLLFAGFLGAVIGIGYGFRSDLLIFLFPGIFTICVLGQVDLPAIASSFKRVLANAGMRAMAAAVFILSFAVGGWMPLLNDYYFHDHYSDVGYHVMAMGQLGHLRYALYQNSPNGRMYMYQNNYDTDMSVGLRVIEYAKRSDGAELAYNRGQYWTYAKRYYLNVVKFIPADLVSGAIGAFVNVMTVPYSLTYRQAEAPRYNPAAPWVSAYKLEQNTVPYIAARWLDKFYLFLSNLPIEVLLLANLIVLFQMLCLIAYVYGLRGVLSTMTLLASMIFVTSLKFEIRHDFYVYLSIIFSWGIVMTVWICAAWRILNRLLSRKRLLSTTAGPIGNRVSPHSQSVLVVTSSIIIVCVLTYGTLMLARVYQESVLRSLIADWTKRHRVAAKFETLRVDDKRSLLRVSSPIPLSTGGERLPDAPIMFRPGITKTQMGVVSVTIDGKACQGRTVNISTVDDTYMPRVGLPPFGMGETFFVRIASGTDYVVFLPAFFSTTSPFLQMKFSGLELPSEDVGCVKDVSFVTEFKRNDVLFDFFVPKDSTKLRPGDLFERVSIPGIGLI